MEENSSCLEILSLLLPQRVPDVPLAALDLPLDKVEQDVLIDLENKRILYANKNITKYYWTSSLISVVMPDNRR